MADFKDPLWPEHKDLWEGGRPLAPRRPRKAPPLNIPKSGTPEQEGYILNPDIQPVAPPKGDVKTGQPVGPAFTKAPRDMQRGWVDQAFRDMVRNPEKAVTMARSMEGSVFDTDADKTIRGLSSGSVPSGVVMTPGTAPFKEIVKRDPRWAKVLERSKYLIGMGQKPSRYFDRKDGPVEGVTHSLRQKDIPRAAEEIAKGRGARSSSGLIEPEDLKDLTAYSIKQPGSSLQQYPKTHNSDRDPMVAKYHEGYHSLYGNESLKMAPERARELMHRVLDRSNMSAMDRFRTAAQYDKDPNHGLIDALAQYRYGKGGWDVK